MGTTKVLGNTVIRNGMAEDAASFEADMSGEVIYEVIRLMDRKILFLDDHLRRLQHSLSASGMKYPGDGVIRDSLRKLIDSCGFPEGNIRICLRHNPEGQTDLLCYHIPYNYPESCVYLSGVEVISFPHVRPNPEIKKWDDAFRTSVNEEIRAHGVYEAILLNERKEVTEGSRSNVFFVDNHGELVSPPPEEFLPGITRKYVLDICLNEGIRVTERPVPYGECKGFSGCFLTGTSPKVLPVWKLDGIRYGVDYPVIRTLMEKFDRVLADNMETIV